VRVSFCPFKVVTKKVLVGKKYITFRNSILKTQIIKAFKSFNILPTPLRLCLDLRRLFSHLFWGY
jgi:hypothetical protein